MKREGRGRGEWARGSKVLWWVTLVYLKIATLIVVQEELQRAKETHAHSQVLYEKEVRRARKEAFKSSSALVKLQEELKSTRNKFTLMREEVEVQRRKVDCKDQETFTAQYQLVGLQEDMDALRRQMKTTEDEREVLKTNLREEEIARIAAEGMIALPISREGDEFASPKKKKTPKKRGSLKENQDPELSDEDDELLVLKKQLKIEMRLRKNAHDQIDFMKMECQYQCCSCRVAEKQGKDYIHDGSVAEAVTQMSSMSHDDRVTTPRRTSPAISATPIATPTQRSPPQRPQDTESLINFSPSTGTFYTTPSTAKEHPSLFRQPSEQSPTTNPNTPCRSSKNTTPTITNIPQPPPPTFNLFPSTPQPHPHTTSTTSTTTTTTLIPLAPLASPTAPPSSISREQALEQIRQRRGRARSVAAGTATPRKLMAGSGVGERRDLSAPQSVGRRW